MNLKSHNFVDVIDERSSPTRKAMYKYIHSLHHRNTDIEPFAGLCMHPVEHLYYYRVVQMNSHML